MEMCVLESRGQLEQSGEHPLFYLWSQGHAFNYRWGLLYAFAKINWATLILRKICFSRTLQLAFAQTLHELDTVMPPQKKSNDKRTKQKQIFLGNNNILQIHRNGIATYKNSKNLIILFQHIQHYPCLCINFCEIIYCLLFFSFYNLNHLFLSCVNSFFETDTQNKS